MSFKHYNRNIIKYLFPFLPFMKMNQIICYENVWLSSPDEINLTMETILTQLVLGCWTNLGACWRAPFNVEEKSCSASSGCYINIEEAVWSKIFFQLRWSVRLISSGVVVSCSLSRHLFIQFLATHVSIHKEPDNVHHSTWKRFLFWHVARQKGAHGASSYQDSLWFFWNISSRLDRFQCACYQRSRKHFFRLCVERNLG